MPKTPSTHGLLPCSLCQFDIASGDDILVGKFPHFQGLKWDPEDESTLASLKEAIRRSKGEPDRYTGGFQCHHSACLQMVELDDPGLLMQFVYAMTYKHRPTLQHRDSRRHRLRTCLSAELLKHFALEGYHLPPELWNQIAEHLLPHYASARARSLWKKTAQSELEPASLAKGIWCKYVEFEGTRYIARLSNIPSDGWELIYRPSGETIKYMYTGENHLGIMRLLFSTSPNAPEIDETPGIWWRTIDIEDQDLTLRGNFDGIKLRRFSDLVRDALAWSIPTQRAKIRFECLAVVVRKKSLDLMSCLTFNQPSTVGYSILWAGCMVTIHAHQGIQDWTCYQSAPSGSWLHMPVDAGEVITEIWRLRRRQPRERALGFRTNFGRVFIAGIYCHALYSRPRLWSLVDRPNQSRMFYDAPEKEITLLAFENPSPIGPNLLFPPHLPSEEDPVYTRVEDYFYSEHYLAGLVRVTPCKIRNSRGISGMLLHFSNGHRESVGQVRLDCLCPPIDLEDSDSASWYLAFDKVDGRYYTCTYLAAIMATQRSSDSNFEKVTQLSCEGKLEWFWSSQHCYVTYDQTSQKPGLPELEE